MIYLAGLKRELPSELELIELSFIKYFDFNIAWEPYDALILSSKNAILAMEKNSILIPANIRVYCLSKELACMAEKLGANKLFYPTKAYASSLLEDFDFKAQSLLYLRAKKISSSLDLALKNGSKAFKEIIAYENVSFKKEEIKGFDEIDGKYKLAKNSCVIFLAASAAKTFKSYFHTKDLRLIAIGKSCAKELEYCEIAKTPSFKECLKLAKSKNEN